MTEDQAMSWFMAIAGTIVLMLVGGLVFLIMKDMYLWIGLWGVVIPLVGVYLLSHVTRRLYVKIEELL